MSFLDSWVIDRERMMSFSRRAFYRGKSVSTLKHRYSKGR